MAIGGVFEYYVTGVGVGFLCRSQSDYLQELKVDTGKDSHLACDW